jgi:hypothetical protein
LIILIILPINSQEIKELPEKPSKNIEKLTKEEIYNFAYQYYKQCVRLEKELNRLINEIETEIKISEDKDRIIKEYESVLNKYEKLKSKYGLGLSIYGGLTQELRAESIVSLDVYFYFLNVAFLPGIYVKIYDTLGGGIKLGFVINF